MGLSLESRLFSGIRRTLLLFWLLGLCCIATKLKEYVLFSRGHGAAS